MAASKRTCVFCGGVPLTGEHLFPDWMNDHLVFPPGHVLEARHTERGKRRVHGFNDKAKVCCESCNTGWMSNVEGNAVPVFKRLFSATAPVDLSADERRALSVWAYNRALVLEAAHPKKRIIKEDLHEMFYKSRLPIPDFSAVWAFAYQGEAHEGFFDRTGLLCMNLGELLGDPTVDAPPVLFAMYTIVALGVGVQVILPSSGHMFPDPQDLQFRTDLPRLQIWPPPAGPLQSFPSGNMGYDDQALAQLCHHNAPLGFMATTSLKESHNPPDAPSR
ncbi:MAG: hypothetical protein Q8L55_02635 [Phycisphaerales bacterium]|nr:hypothetical protein [Phycisphaerales bacterium]